MKEVLQKKLKNRLKRAEGQIRGIESMIDRNKYYLDIVTQISAVKSALISVENILIENHLDTVSEQSNINAEMKVEIMKIFNKRK